jgi:hypothetical protein
MMFSPRRNQFPDRPPRDLLPLIVDDLGLDIGNGGADRAVFLGHVRRLKEETGEASVRPYAFHDFDLEFLLKDGDEIRGIAAPPVTQSFRESVPNRSAPSKKSIPKNSLGTAQI